MRNISGHVLVLWKRGSRGGKLFIIRSLPFLRDRIDALSQFEIPFLLDLDRGARRGKKEEGGTRA